MFAQMLADLILGRRHKAKADLIANGAGRRANGKRRGVKEWV